MVCCDVGVWVGVHKYFSVLGPASQWPYRYYSLHHYRVYGGGCKDISNIINDV